MPDILTVTLNPALDMSSAVMGVKPEDKLRCETPTYDPGGGGINVARAIVQLGGTSKAFVAAGGYRGAQLCDLLEQEGVGVIRFPVMGETRLSLAVFDKSDGQQYRFVMPGPDWNDQVVTDALDAIGSALAGNGQGGHLVLSGSQPPGVPDNFPARLASTAQRYGAKLVLDTSGPPLQALMRGSAPPHVLRLDGSESEALAGVPLKRVNEVADFANALVARGVAGMVVLALGANGSVLAQNGRRWHASTPRVKVKSKVGAGDSFVGAFTLALSRGAAPSAALGDGVAAASAAVMSDATSLCHASDFQDLRKKVKVSEV
ncbi:MAG: 1-phosphofructokinase family hexose kinase [Rhodobacteraceae bacterium]|nr:1-phosphofructokinase family hexose kinase [Paracoccaceae bacterium]